MFSFIKKIFSKSRTDEDGIFCDKCEKIIGFRPVNTMHYKYAFTHRSANKTDSNGNPVNYERLEFLGDAILGTVIAVHLYQHSATGDEGYLTKMRSKIVNRENLNRIGKRMGLIRLVDSKIQRNQFGENIYGNILEALIGAIYLDKGYDFCADYIHKHLIESVQHIETLECKVSSYKSLFIEYCQKEKKTFFFETYEDDSRENVKYFAVKLHHQERIIAKARATSKKKAEEKAAQRAYFALQKSMKRYTENQGNSQK